MRRVGHPVTHGARDAIAFVIGTMLAVFGAMVAGAEDTKIEASSLVRVDDLKIDMSVRAREPRAITPRTFYEMGPGELSYDPGSGSSIRYEPVFIPPFTIAVERPDVTGRMGLSGWTSPRTPMGPSGAGVREVDGWISFGFTWTWGGR